MTQRGSAQKPTVSKFVVRWSDATGNHSKEYDTHQLASKAMRWLADKGVEDIDLAVSVPKREKPPIES